MGTVGIGTVVICALLGFIIGMLIVIAMRLK